MNKEILDKNPVITICAPRNSGKSYLTRKILMKFSDYWDNIVIFCPTLKFNDDYEDLGENSNKVQIYRVSDFEGSDIERIFNDHEEAKENCKKREREIKKGKKNHHF